MNYNCTKVLTCFYENEDPGELVAVNFNIENNEINILKSLPSIYKTNDGCQQIESTLSLNKTKAFVCYIDNYSKCHCLFYDIQKNEWQNDKIFFEACDGTRRSLFENKYFRYKKEYVIYCFSNAFIFNMKRLDSNFNVLNLVDGSDTCAFSLISNGNFNCNKISFPSLVFCPNYSFYKYMDCCENDDNYNLLDFNQTW